MGLGGTSFQHKEVAADLPQLTAVWLCCQTRGHNLREQQKPRGLSNYDFETQLREFSKTWPALSSGTSYGQNNPAKPLQTDKCKDLGTHLARLVRSQNSADLWAVESPGTHFETEDPIFICILPKKKNM